MGLPKPNKNKKKKTKFGEEYVEAKGYVHYARGFGFFGIYRISTSPHWEQVLCCDASDLV